MIENVKEGIKGYKKQLEGVNERFYSIMSLFDSSTIALASKHIKEETSWVHAMECVLKISASEREEIIRETKLIFPIDIFDTSYSELEEEMKEYWKLKG